MINRKWDSVLRVRCGGRLFSVLAATVIGALSLQAQAPSPWWPQTIEARLAEASTNRAELVRALTEVPATQREGLQFLVENMPEQDLRTLSATFLLENLSLAYQARQEFPWAKAVPMELFFNDVLPYASVSERRDSWRKEMRERCAPLVQDCRSASEAAIRLNQKLFGMVKVRYSTERKSADQSPAESMESGLASCTGLSILLVDACRSVGIPARVAGTPMWMNMRGNHTWVEIWDGQWHFTGACEQDPTGLDRGWFTHDASLARKDLPEHAIYASSFKKTGLAFPMVWARGREDVSAVNVTENYTPKGKTVEENKARLLVKVLDRPAGKRVAAKVTVHDPKNPASELEGTSRTETNDLNDILPLEVLNNRVYEVRVADATHTVTNQVFVGTGAQYVTVVYLNEPSTAGDSVTKELKGSDREKLTKAFMDFFAAPAERQAGWKFPNRLEKLLAANEPAVRQVAWEAYKNAPIHEAQKKDFDAKQVRFESHLSPYTVKTVGSRPAKGWPLFIAMHGGGGAPKEVNDSQWKIMQSYYRDHAESGGYIYVALRAPDDSWNGFYTDYAYPLVANLLHQMFLFGEVDPNKVFIMGYSHGGYGAFAIGPKMPDHFAAIHASAAAPTDGETTAKTLRSTVFTYMIGEKDTDYGRIDRCRKFDETVAKLAAGRSDIYPVKMEFVPGNGHRGLPDKDKIADMYPAVRNPVPREVTWLMTDTVIKDFFWLNVPNPSRGQEIDATCRDNRLTVTTTPNVTKASVLLDARMVNLDKPVVLELNGKPTRLKVQPSLLTLCQTLLDRADPNLAFTCRIDLPLAAAGGAPLKTAANRTR